MSLNKDLKYLLHRYTFALKEGKDIQNDYLDYTLMMFQNTPIEHIPSPGKEPSDTKFPFIANDDQSNKNLDNLPF